MSEQPGKSGARTKLSRRELDKIEADLIKRPFERRDYAGDPRQPQRLWVRLTRNLKFKKG